MLQSAGMTSIYCFGTHTPRLRPKKEHKDKCWGQGICRWGGALAHEGVGTKKLVCSSKTSENKLFGEVPPAKLYALSRKFMELRGAHKKFENKQFVFNCWLSFQKISWSHDKATPWKRAQENFLEVSCLLRSLVFR